MRHSFAYPCIPDLGNGRYRNPVLHADYSDPDVIRVGGDYWMTASSFNCTPGLPILHSRDLVNWTLVNHALPNLPGDRFSQVQAGCGVWAPSIRFHDGKLWIFFPMVDEGIYVTIADDPYGEWSEPWCLVEAKGWIDPCPFWDDDGKAYMVHAYAFSRSGRKEILHLRQMTPDAKSLLPGDKEIIHGPHHPYLEGPKLHKFNGWYYILAPGGGVTKGWQVAYRSRTIEGPYEEKIVLEQGSSAINGPHQGALIDIPSNGEKVPGEASAWWFIHFQDAGPFGRITHLNPVRWEEGWPLMGVDHDGNGTGEPVTEWEKPFTGSREPVAAPPTSDEFDALKLGLQWQWHANHKTDWASFSERPGWLTLHALLAGRDEGGKELPPHLTPHLLAQKFPAREFRVTALADGSALGEGARAGLAVIGGGHSAFLALCHKAGQWTLSLELDGVLTGSAVSLPNPMLLLSVSVSEGALCSFSYALPGETPKPFPGTFTAGEGGWIGAKVGLLCTGDSGAAAFDYFRFTDAC
jgi:beta-xylosidase